MGLPIAVQFRDVWENGQPGDGSFHDLSCTQWSAFWGWFRICVGFFFEHFDIHSLKNTVPLEYWWTEQNSHFLLESFSKLFRDPIKPFTCGFFFFKTNGTTYPALNIFSKCKTKTKQKPLKLFKSSFKQCNHIYTHVQNKTRDRSPQCQHNVTQHLPYLLFVNDFPCHWTLQKFPQFPLASWSLLFICQCA